MKCHSPPCRFELPRCSVLCEFHDALLSTVIERDGGPCRWSVLNFKSLAAAALSPRPLASLVLTPVRDMHRHIWAVGLIIHLNALGTDPGIKINIYQTLPSYTIPGKSFSVVLPHSVPTMLR